MLDEDPGEPGCSPGTCSSQWHVKARGACHPVRTFRTLCPRAILHLWLHF